MRNLIKLHYGLLLYLKTELPKLKSFKELIVFSKNTIKRYYEVMLSEYKTLFLYLNEDYRKQKKQYDKIEKLKKDFNRALKMLQYIDDKMGKSGISRASRRQFWRDFFKDGQVRKDIFNQLLKEIT